MTGLRPVGIFAILMVMKHEPAASVIDLFGGVRPLARDLGPYLDGKDSVDPATIDRWQRAKPRGCGGMIPSHYHRPLLLLARATGRRLTAEELIFGPRETAA